MNTSVTKILALALFLFMSCSKKEVAKPPQINNENERIKTLTMDASQQMVANYFYDDEKRLRRIDYSETNGGGHSSLRLEYAPQSITAKFYKGAAPDPMRETYLFTLLNDKVVTTTVNNADGNRMDIYYEYDNEDRTSEVGIRGISANGSLYMSLDLYFTYIGETQKLKYYGSWTTPTDSIVETRTYYTDAKFFSLANVGFNYFGTVSTGLDYQVAGMFDLSIPFPFFKSRVLVHPSNPGLTPAPFPLQKMTREGKARDMINFQNNGWMQVSGGGSFPFATSYKYDDKNRLISFWPFSFTWY